MSGITRVRIGTMWRWGLMVCAALCLMPGCGRDADDEVLDREAWSKKLMVAIDGQMTPERRAAFETELAVATANYDDSQLDPAEVVQARDLQKTRADGVYFHRYIVDGREVTPAEHEPLRTGERTGRRCAPRRAWTGKQGRGSHGSARRDKAQPATGHGRGHGSVAGGQERVPDPEKWTIDGTAAGHEGAHSHRCRRASTAGVDRRR